MTLNVTWGSMPKAFLISLGMTICPLLLAVINAPVFILVVFYYKYSFYVNASGLDDPALLRTAPAKDPMNSLVIDIEVQLRLNFIYENRRRQRTTSAPERCARPRTTGRGCDRTASLQE